MEIECNAVALKASAEAINKEIDTIISQNTTLEKYINELKGKNSERQGISRSADYDKVISIDEFLKKATKIQINRK